jgi:hypothetical protein
MLSRTTALTNALTLSRRRLACRFIQRKVFRSTRIVVLCIVFFIVRLIR